MQQSNVEPTDEMLTQEILIGPQGAPLSERMGPSMEYLPKLGNDVDPATRAPAPRPASEPIKAADGSSWRIVKLQLRGTYEESFYYIPADAVTSAAEAGTYEAAAELARQAKWAAQSAHDAAFQGTGTVKSGAGWYANEDSTKAPIAVADGLGFQAQMTDAYPVAGAQWRKISIYTEGAPHTYFVQDADVTNYTPKATPSPTAAEAPTEEATMPADATAPVAKADQPNNLGLALGLGALVLVASGGYWIWDKRRKAVKSAAAEEPGQEK
ncbi:hypothetical protein AB4Y80_06350 [Specibacter sp. RAF43]